MRERSARSAKPARDRRRNGARYRLPAEISPGTKARVDPTSTQEQHHLRWLTLSGESRFIRLRSLSASRFPSATGIGSMPRNRLSSSSTLLLMMARPSVMRFKRVAGLRACLIVPSYGYISAALLLRRRTSCQMPPPTSATRRRL